MNDHSLIATGLRNRILRRMIEYGWLLNDPRIQLLRFWHREMRVSSIWINSAKRGPYAQLPAAGL